MRRFSEPPRQPARTVVSALRVASHEYVSICRDVSRSTTWRDRLSFVLRGPGWAYDRHRHDQVAVAG